MRLIIEVNIYFKPVSSFYVLGVKVGGLGEYEGE